MEIGQWLAQLRWELWGGPLLLLAGSLVIGWVLERLVRGAARKVLHHTSIDVNESVSGLLRGIILAICVLFGLDLATAAMTFVTDSSKAIVHKILFIFGMLLAIRLLAQLAVVLVRFYLNRRQELTALPNTSIFENILRFTVYLLGALVLLQTMGISVTPLITALGIGGLAVSLALQDTLANMFAGVNMLLARQIKVGDYVKLEGNFEGAVEDIGWRTTIIRPLNNNHIIVPNSKMASAIITNCTLPLPETSFSIEVSVSYDSDLAKVEAVTLEVARDVLKSVEGAMTRFEPSVRFHNFGDTGVRFSVNLQVQSLPDQFLVRHEFIKRLFARYRQEGILVPYTQHVIYLNDRDQVIQQVTEPDKKTQNHE